MFSYTLFIMLLPLLSFIVLGLAGMKMQHKVAGLIGTCSLGIVTILSYLTAFQYFGMDRVDGVYQTFVQRDDAGGYLYSITDGSYLLIRLYAW